MSEHFKIHKELESLLPPLDEQELKQLEDNVLEDGIREPLIVARIKSKELLCDGHNRLSIARKFDLNYELKYVEFASLVDVKVWMIRNQKGRRNLSDGWQYDIMLVLKKLLLVKGKEKQGARTDLKNNILSTVDKKSKHNTQKEIAKELNWSTGKVAMADRVWKDAPKEVVENVKAGKTTINQAYKDVKKEEKRENLKEAKAKYESSIKAEIKDAPILFKMNAASLLLKYKDNSIDLVITDPPYSTDVKDIVTFIDEWLPVLIAKVSKRGRIFICAGAYPVEIAAYSNALLKQSKFIIDCPLIWTYRNTLGVTPKMKYNLNYQIIWHLYSKDSDPLDTSITNEMFSVQDISAPDGRQANRYHAWQKPDELGLRLIKHTTKEGQIVVDPFCGTGTFVLAAAKLKRIAEGGDIDENNLLIAEKRGCNVKF